MYTYGRFTSLYSRNQYNIVKQLHPNRKTKKDNVSLAKLTKVNYDKQC